MYTNFDEMIAVKEWKASIATAFVHFSGRVLVKRGYFGQPEAQPYLYLLGWALKSRKRAFRFSNTGSPCTHLNFLER